MHRISLYLLLVFLLLGCTVSPTGTTPGPTAPDTAAPPPSPGPTFPPWPTPSGDQEILPAALYFVSASRDEYAHMERQIVRLEKDGRTRTPVLRGGTDERIDGFDVSRADGAIVFAAQGRLWLVDAANGEVEWLLTGLPNPEGTGSSGVADPAWSPDGTRIAYADGGIRIVDLATGVRTDVVEDNYDEYEDIAWGTSPGQYGEFFFSPHWSPDGEAILFRKQTPTSPSQMAFTLRDGTLSYVPGTLGVVDNDIAWTRDGRALLFDAWWHGVPKVDEPAFVRLSRDGWAAQVLWQHGDRADPVFSSRANNPRQVRYPFETRDGRILFFQAEPCDTGSCYQYALVEGTLTPDGFNTRVLRRNALPEVSVYDFVWHDGGEFAALVTSVGHTWLVAVMRVRTGEVWLLSQEDEHPSPVIWAAP